MATPRKPKEKVKWVEESTDRVVRDPRAQAWHDLLNQLKEKPEHWAIVREYDDERHAYDAFNRLRKYKDSLVPNGIWQMKTQQRTNNGIVDGSVLKARFMGESDTPEILKAIKGRVASSAYDNDTSAATLS